MSIGKDGRISGRLIGLALLGIIVFAASTLQAQDKEEEDKFEWVPAAALQPQDIVALRAKEKADRFGKSVVHNFLRLKATSVRWLVTAPVPATSPETWTMGVAVFMDPR